MSQLKVASIRDLTDARGFSLSGGGISTIGTLTVGNLVVNGQIQGQSAYVIPPQTGNSGKFLVSNGPKLDGERCQLLQVFAQCKCGHLMAHGQDHQESKQF